MKEKGTVYIIIGVTCILILILLYMLGTVGELTDFILILFGISFIIAGVIEKDKEKKAMRTKS